MGTQGLCGQRLGIKARQSLRRWRQLVSPCWTRPQAGPQLPCNKDTKLLKAKLNPTSTRAHKQPITINRALWKIPTIFQATYTISPYWVRALLLLLTYFRFSGTPRRFIFLFFFACITTINLSVILKNVLSRYHWGPTETQDGHSKHDKSLKFIGNNSSIQNVYIKISPRCLLVRQIETKNTSIFFHHLCECNFKKMFFCGS